MEQLIREVIPPIISALVGGFIGWFFTRRSMEAEIELKVAEANLKRAEAKEIEENILKEQLKLLKEELEKTKSRQDELEKKRMEDSVTIVQFLSMLCGDMQCLRRAPVEIAYEDGSIKIKKGDLTPKDYEKC